MMERFWSREWRDTLQRNWTYMVTAGVLSVLLWVMVSAGTVAQEIVDADLVVVNADRRFVITGREPEAATASVLFSGTTADLLAITMARPRLVVTIDSVRSQLQMVALDVGMVRGRDGRTLGDVRPLSIIHPDTLRLRFEARAQRTVRVVPRVRLQMADGFMLSDSIRVSPGAIAIEGPESVIGRIDSLTTTPLVRANVRESVRVEVPIDRPGHPAVEVSSGTVELILRVDQRVERKFEEVPVALRGASDSIGIDPQTVDLYVLGPAEAVTEMSQDSLNPTVRLPDEWEIGARLPVAVPAPRAFLRVRPDPDSVRLIVPIDTLELRAPAASRRRN